MRRRTMRDAALVAVLTSMMCLTAIGTAEAVCIIDWNGDSQVTESDYLEGDPIGGYYAEWYIDQFYPSYYPILFPDGDPALLDFNVDGIVDQLDLMGPLDAGLPSEGFYVMWYIYTFYPAYFPIFFPESTCMQVCEDVLGVDFGECDELLGAAVVGGTCVGIWGCDAAGYQVFADVDACNADCKTPRELCDWAEGTWEYTSKGGDYVCGQPPADSGSYLPGCNCGNGMKLDDTQGCIVDDTCVPPTCDDLGTIDFGLSTGECNYSLGWAVLYGACAEVHGCGDLTYGFYSSRDECNAACATPQRLCMESGGAWAGDAVDGPIWPVDACVSYDCGDKVDGCTTVPPCNCGPGSNYVDGVGCQVDAGCPTVSTTCTGYDFATDYTPTCGAVPLPGYYGLWNGVCSFIFGCLDDFEGPNAFVDPANYFPSTTECEAVCAERCQTSDDCDAGDFCSFEADSNCGAFTGGGTCKQAGGSCIQVFDPVCGCDGENVTNIGCVDVVGNSMHYDGECFSFPPLS